MTLYRQWQALACLITYANNKGADHTVHKCLCCLQLVLFIYFLHYSHIQFFRIRNIRAVIAFTKVVQPLNTIGVRWVQKVRARSVKRERGFLSTRIRGWGGKTLKPKMSVEVTQINFVTNFACGKQHIIQSLQVGVFKHVSNTTTKVSTYFFFIWSLVVWFLFCNFHRIFPLGIAFTFCTLQCSHGENSGKKKFMVGKSQ